MEINEQIMEHIELLGKKVKDKVTGLVGIVVSVSFDLSGCLQAAINPGLKQDGTLGTASWFDTMRLEIIDTVPVITPPVLMAKNKEKKLKETGAMDKPDK